MNKPTKDLIRNYARKVLPGEALAIPRELIVTSNAPVYLVTPVAEPNDPQLSPPSPTGVYVTCLMVMSLDELKRAGVLTAENITGVSDAPMEDGKVRARKARVPKVEVVASTPQEVLASMDEEERAMREQVEKLTARMAKRGGA